jgi:hypothetical protein
MRHASARLARRAPLLLAAAGAVALLSACDAAITAPEATENVERVAPTSKLATSTTTGTDTSSKGPTQPWW